MEEEQKEKLLNSINAILKESINRNIGTGTIMTPELATGIYTVLRERIFECLNSIDLVPKSDLQEIDKGEIDERIKNATIRGRGFSTRGDTTDNQTD